ncbi:hypothetical protein [Membranihabitans maritimus]|uniref:hypothetical protein n=1 Tax=Membranihabitans maritimus TaxID=2904244 RepID=UPI001F3CC8E8|nr:hypothetical protein [Membranihabitans maritimus]
MKKQILSIMVFMMLSLTSDGQSFWDDVTISAQFAAAHHDKRLIGWSQSYRERIERQNPETWGTWQYGISANKKIYQRGSFTTEIGLGYSLEHMTMIKEVDFCQYQSAAGICHSIAYYTDDYKIHMVQVPVLFSTEVFTNLFVNVYVLPFIDWSKDVRFDGRSGINKTGLNFYSLEVNPGLNYEWNQFRLGLNYRIWQVKKIDRILYSKATVHTNSFEDRIITKNYEAYNPFKLWFSLGYRLGSE